MAMSYRLSSLIDHAHPVEPIIVEWTDPVTGASMIVGKLVESSSPSIADPPQPPASVSVSSVSVPSHITLWTPTRTNEQDTPNGSQAEAAAVAAITPSPVSAVPAASASSSSCSSPLAGLPPFAPLHPSHPAYAYRRLSDSDREPLLDFLSMFLPSGLPAPLSSRPSTRLDDRLEAQLYDAAQTCSGGVEGIIDTLLTMPEEKRPKSIYHLLNAIHKQLGIEPRQPPNQPPNLTIPSVCSIGVFGGGLSPASDCSDFVTIPPSRFEFESDHDSLSRFLARTNLIGVTTQAELDEMIGMAGSIQALIKLMQDEWQLAQPEEDETDKQNESASEATISQHAEEKEHAISLSPHSPLSPNAPLFLSDLLDRLRSYPWPADSSGSRRLWRRGSSADHAPLLPGDITDEERQEAQDIILRLEMMNRATEPVVFTTEHLTNLIIAAGGILHLRPLLASLHSHRNFSPQSLSELSFLLSEARRGRWSRRSEPMHLQIARAQREVDRQDRAATQANERQEQERRQARRAARAAAALAGEPFDDEDGDSDADVPPGAVDDSVFLDELAGLDGHLDDPMHQPNQLLDAHHAHVDVDEAAQLDPDGQPQQDENHAASMIKLLQQKLAVDARAALMRTIVSSGILSDAGLDECELHAIDLSLLLPDCHDSPVASSGDAARLTFAADSITLLASNGLRPKSLTALRDAVRQHYAHANMLRPHAMTRAQIIRHNQRTTTRNGRCNIM